MSFKDELNELDIPVAVVPRETVRGLENISVVSEDATREEAERIWPLLEASLDPKIGFGLSAIQLGIPKKVGIIKYNGEIYRLLNTTLSKGSQEITIYNEGCLSLPGKLVNTTRFAEVTIKDDFLGIRTYNMSTHAMLPVIFQHEIAHFEGKTILDFKRKPIRRESPKIGRNSPCPCGSGKKYKKCCADS